MTELSFAALDLPANQLLNLDALGYHTMTEIQARALPLALAGKDLVAQAKTGSGKTAAFGLALLQHLNPRDFGTQALVLCPTRELATQVAEEIRRLARFQQNIKVVVLCGGQPIGPQIGSLEHGAHVVVGTPGRIQDHLRKQTLSVERVKCLVLDEADRMLAMGFIEDIRAIIAHTPETRQTLFFSATYPDDIAAMSRDFQRSPEHIHAASLHTETQIAQHWFSCERQSKLDALSTLLGHFQPEACVVFCNTKQMTRDVVEALSEQGIHALALNGDMEQRDRDQVLVQFKQGSCRDLVATDVAARGLDIDELPAVINMDLPRDPEVFIHRIGRTGRAGKNGLALSLCTHQDEYLVAQISDFQEDAIAPKPISAISSHNATLPAPAYRTLCIAGGRKDKVRPGDILGALTGEAGLEASAVGKIQVLEYAAYVAIESKLAKQALGRLINGKIKGRKFKVRIL